MTHREVEGGHTGALHSALQFTLGGHAGKEVLSLPGGNQVMSVAKLVWLEPLPQPPLLPPKINLLPLPTGSLVFSLVGQQLLGGRNAPRSPPHHNSLPPRWARPSSNNATPRQSRGTLQFSLRRWRLGDNVGLQCPFLGCFFAPQGEPRNILQPNHRQRRDLFFCTNHYYICKKKKKSSRASFDVLDFKDSPALHLCVTRRYIVFTAVNGTLHA